ncbi:MAG: SDR family NAD(P)-dependent oxidoreductase [Sulfitobacter sp.]|jgi:3-oxoacyl-[acyl-carrier protein] reductase|uniref:SDR family NAD(P)-dependent oxidoreductase n=2 Tax=Sulfitobacter sp. TaxID=1903071 RepID=UPI000C5F5124|nr:oxidoreductase [Roseobacter sp.]MBV50326.1 oxidoreductase [Roseobacter sp.]|tara:strand:- start:322 stop:1068 length:747 start_codon:yes stop_codon:yes gene_type:complete
MNLAGKTVIVTGGGRDIGRACVMELAAQGANVAINYFASSKGADSAVDEIKAGGGKAFAQQGDMTKEADVAALVSKTVETFGQVDSLIHVTGGILKRVPLAEMSLDHWQAVMDVNLTSFVLMVRACLPHMSQGASIVGLASQAGRDGGGPGASAYGAAKGALMTLTRGLAKELGPNIRVNSICPGMIDTDFHNIFTKPEVRTHVANVTPLKREGTSQEVAKLAVFLASDDAAFITGTNVDINGGTLFS